MARTRWAVPVLAAALLTAACGTGNSGAPDASATPSPAEASATSADGPAWMAEVRLSWHGGLCPEGACTYAVRAEQAAGTWELVDGGRFTSGSIAPARVAEVARWVDDRWDAVTAEPFTDTCPTAYDGREMTIELAFLPTGPDAHLADADRRTTTSCTHAWPDGFAEELLDVWDEAGLAR